MDVTSRIISAIPPSAAAGHIPMFAVNGFYGIINKNLFHSNLLFFPWVQYEFVDLVTVSKIIVKTRYAPHWPTHFDMVEVRLGNTSHPNGNFSSATLVGNYERYARSGAILVVQVTPPIAGKYLSFKCHTDHYNYVLIADLKVLGY